MIKSKVLSVFLVLVLGTGFYSPITLAETLPVKISSSNNHLQKQSIEILTEKASKGDAKAQCKLGAMFSKGEGVAKDYKKAFPWYEKSALQGFRVAQYNLAVAYVNAEGVAQDYKKAFYWNEKSAMQNWSPAQYNLAVAYENGEGVAKDYKKAFYWYKKAAEGSNLGLAQGNLARCYFWGQGTQKSMLDAYIWWRLAYLNGDSCSKKASEEVSEKLTPEQRVKADELIKNWRMKFTQKTQ
jgi:TPR repeat protein